MKQLNELKGSSGLNPEEDEVQNETLRDMLVDIDEQMMDDAALDKILKGDYFGAAEISKETFSDFKEYIIDEDVLSVAFPDASIDRIRVEREFQASHYVMKKFLNTDNKSKLAESKAGLVDKEDAFKEFICPICLKIIQKCVTTLCGHSFCECCLENYLIFKEVSKLHFSSNFYSIYSVVSFVIFTALRA